MTTPTISLAGLAEAAGMTEDAARERLEMAGVRPLLNNPSHYRRAQAERVVRPISKGTPTRPNPMRRGKVEDARLHGRVTFKQIARRLRCSFDAARKRVKRAGIAPEVEGSAGKPSLYDGEAIEAWIEAGEPAAQGEVFDVSIEDVAAAAGGPGPEPSVCTDLAGTLRVLEMQASAERDRAARHAKNAEAFEAAATALRARVEE